MLNFLEGIAPIAAQYDGFIMDVWGVLHNGFVPYPHVVDALNHLRDAGKRVVLLSNAPIRAEAVLSRVDKIGIPQSLLDGVMSSGEEVWQSLSTRPDDFYIGLGRRCLWLGPERHAGMTQGLDFTLTDDPGLADFILNTGPDNLDDEATSLLPLLERAIARKLPMICANPDLHVIEGTRRVVCAGQISKVYERLGGYVRWHGKPFISVYQSSLKLLGISNTNRILAVGDSLRTDIAGATNAGLDSLLIAGGIHADEFGVLPGSALDTAPIIAAIGNGPTPNYIINHFAW